MTLDKYNPQRLVIFSRDEMTMKCLNFTKMTEELDFLLEITDKDRLKKPNGIDYVIHVTATKIVTTAEYNPFECVKTNITGAMNSVDTCIDMKVKRVVALSTDKASAPANLYGATKLVSDKLFIAGNSYTRGETIFSVVRYGNVMGSRGSIIPFFIKERKKGILPITDKKMTRFMITLEQGVGLVWEAFDDMVGGEIYVKKIPSMKIMDIAECLAPEARINIIGIQPGEKLHEQMISTDDSNYTYEYKNYFKILPAIHGWNNDNLRIKQGKLVNNDFFYSSSSNSEWMTKNDLKNWVMKNKKLSATFELMDFV